MDSNNFFVGISLRLQQPIFAAQRPVYVQFFNTNKVFCLPFPNFGSFQLFHKRKNRYFEIMIPWVLPLRPICSSFAVCDNKNLQINARLGHLIQPTLHYLIFPVSVNRFNDSVEFRVECNDPISARKFLPKLIIERYLTPCSHRAKVENWLASQSTNQQQNVTFMIKVYGYTVSARSTIGTLPGILHKKLKQT